MSVTRVVRRGSGCAIAALGGRGTYIRPNGVSSSYFSAPPASSSHSSPSSRRRLRIRILFGVLMPSVYRYQQINEVKNEDGENALILDNAHRSSEPRKRNDLYTCCTYTGAYILQRLPINPDLDCSSTSINDWFDQRSPCLAHSISTVWFSAMMPQEESTIGVLDTMPPPSAFG